MLARISRRTRIKSEARQPHHGSAIRRPHRTVIVEEEAVESAAPCRDYAADSRGEIAREWLHSGGGDGGGGSRYEERTS